MALPRRKIKASQEASHFTTGWDYRPESNVVVTQHQADFPTLWGDFRRRAATPPKSSDVLNKEQGQAYQPWTETMDQYQVKPLDCRTPIYPTPVGGMIPVYPGTLSSLPVTQTTYQWPTNIHPPDKIVPDKWQSKIILGDDEPKWPTTSYQASYQDPHGVLEGRLHRRDETSQTENLGDYPADGRLPALPHTESGSSIGEPRQTPKQAFMPKPPKGPLPDVMASRRRQTAKVSLEEEEEWPNSTTTATAFGWKTSERRKLLRREELMPFLLFGDKEGKKEFSNITTYRLHFGKPTNEDMRRTLSHPQKEEPLCVTIPGQPVSSSTAYKEHFQPAPHGYRRVEPVQLDLYKTHFELSLPGAGPATTITQDLYAGRKLEKSKKLKKIRRKIKAEDFEDLDMLD